MTRPNWDNYFIKIADVVGSRSTCRTAVGAVFVDTENRIISTGYNGAPSGMPHCIEVGCDVREGGCVRTLHAECNAALHADSRRLREAKLYTSAFTPCLACAKLLVVLKVGEVHAVSTYRDLAGIEFLRAAGIKTYLHDTKGTPWLI